LNLRQYRRRFSRQFEFARIKALRKHRLVAARFVQCIHNLRAVLQHLLQRQWPFFPSALPETSIEKSSA